MAKREKATEVEVATGIETETEEEKPLAMTTGNDGEVKVDEPEVNETEISGTYPKDSEPEEKEEYKPGVNDAEKIDLRDSEAEEHAGKALDPEKVAKKTKDEEIMEVGMDAPVINAAEARVMEIGPSYVVVNRAAILYIVKMIMTPADLADFKVLFPSLFE